MGSPRRIAASVTASLAAIALGGAAEPARGDTGDTGDTGVEAGQWEVGVTTGPAQLTYQSKASLAPASAAPVAPAAPHLLLLPPPMPARCDGCVSSWGEGVSLTAARWVLTTVRVVGSVNASRHPAFGLDVYGAAAGAGVGTWMGRPRLFVHGDVLVGAARVQGALGATSFELKIQTGVAYCVNAHVAVGFEGSFWQLVGERAAGSANGGVYGVELGYRWR